MEGMDEVHDFVVVGSGGGSMCAGLVMRQAGKDVVILEKTDMVGGSTARAGGVMWIPANRFMAEDGVRDSVEQGEEYLNAVVEAQPGDAPGTSREKRRAYIVEANNMIDFLMRQGIPFERAPHWPDYYDDRAGGTPGRTVHAKLFNVNELGEWKEKLRANKFQIPARIFDATRLPLIRVSWASRWIALKVGIKGVMAKLTGKHWVTAGAALQGRMLQAALKAGVDIRLNSPVKEVIIEDNRCVGVVTEKDGKPWRVGARNGVLLNAGGFARNQEMRDKYIPHTKTSWSHTAPGDTGDMHREMMRIGAQMGQMEELVGNQMTLPPDQEEAAGVQMELAKPHAFLVDQSGVRYMSEGGSYMRFCQDMLKRHETVPAVPSWMIMDSQFMSRYMLAGTMPGSAKPPLWLETGFLRTGRTIEELAEACEIPPATLQASVDRFNSFARKGVDEDFGRGANRYDKWLGDHTHKPNDALGTVEKAPFFAVAVYPGDVGTFGGVVTDEKARVKREDGSVIEGLYATGTTTAAVMGRTYPGAGCSIGPSFTFGFIAAKHAANLDNVGV
jgi:3-oxosteroid 1-dehydrogenase